ncbi:MAG: sortase [Anaerolineae bacterium]|nr:sortase [Anaerolineae bacterium]
MLRQRGRRYPLWFIVVLGMLAGVVVLLLESRPGPGADVPLVFPVAPTTTAAPLPVNAGDPPPARPTAAPDIPADAALFFPAAGINAPIVQVYLDGISWDIRSLGRSAGHLQGTALPADGGNVVLSGHVEMADGGVGPFAGLRQAQMGDVIELRMNGEVWRYAVTETWTTTPDDLAPILPTGDERLTLITCGTYDFFSNSYPDRLVVVALRIG